VNKKAINSSSLSFSKAITPKKKKEKKKEKRKEKG
jgi:hypothetical protein